MNNLIQHINGKNIITTELLESMMFDRDKSIHRINLATETMRKLREAKTAEEYNAVHIPEEFLLFGDQFAYFALSSYVSGFSLADEDGTPRCYYGNMGALASAVIPTLFRGELCDYGRTSGFSQLGRKILTESDSKDMETKYFHFLVEQVRRIVFWGFLTSFRQYCEFPFGTPIDGLIAQHYGLNTQFLDLTDDLKIALFFACCKHIGNNTYLPISESDVNKLGNHGVIFTGLSNMATIIGYQPFCRCHRQRGYYIDTAAIEPCWDFKLNHQTGFEKFYFERTVSLSKRIYDEFNGGETLFPKDGLTPFCGAIQQIIQTREFPQRAFEIAYRVLREYVKNHRVNGIIDDELYRTLLDKRHWIRRIEQEGFDFCKQIKIHADSSVIEEMNRNWDPEKYAKDEGINYTPFLVMPASDLK